MLHIYDGQTVAEVTPGRGRELSLGVSAPPAGGPAGLADLRRFLVADLIRRTAQLHRLTVSLAGDGPPPGLAALNIHPPDQAADGADVWVAEAGPGVVPGPATAGTPDLADPLPALAERGLDPLALRLAFLEHHYRDPLEVTWDELDRADATLREWRHQVAVWATQPSKPMCAQYVAELTGAFDNDLDSPAALGSLRALAADPEIPPGSKFETAAYIDRLLGLDMVSEVGRAG
ncbi:MAG TPA: hypothetical protein VHU92_16660 [Streptosporangiaceae bacterium]|nr:hypothetical protein [Streptosporangiaceae bacterium]